MADLLNRTSPGLTTGTHREVVCIHSLCSCLSTSCFRRTDACVFTPVAAMLSPLDRNAPRSRGCFLAHVLIVSS